MNSVLFVGLDIHKKVIAFCAKEADGRIVSEGVLPATRPALKEWAESLDRPWEGAMEATLFTGWIYDFLLPHARALKVAHPKMLKAIAASKKKNDRVDARKIADALRANLLPECHMASPQTRELRRVLRYRNLVVRQSVTLKNKMAGLLMEVGAEYDKKKLHGKRYFADFLKSVGDVPQSVKELLEMSRGGVEMFQRAQRKLLDALGAHPALRRRLEWLTSVGGVGEVTALTWALEVGEVSRFASRRKLISYCGLSSAQKESAGKSVRCPLSKERNRHLQVILIEAAKLAPHWNPALAALHERELQRGNRNRATLAVARRLTCYLLAVDRRFAESEAKATNELPAA
jgi:transposase